ncbi:DUF4192 domain-containing protein [Dactylosporangium sp. McL0621]|uniref:DUF4192 domain-containing protein n=1 Tax=Dactylosporangium sp. McL0621 TaxID=3415678 RepID=UPI003CEEC909
MTSFDGPMAVHSTHDLLVVLPHLIGYHPADSLVCAAFDKGWLRATIRLDLMDDPEDLATAVAVVRSTLAQHQISTAVLVGYGDRDRVTAAVAPTAAALAGIGVETMLIAHVHDGYGSVMDRHGTYLDDIPLNPDGNAAIAAAVMHGWVARSSRAAVANLVAPVTGAERDAMDRADHAARSQLLDLHRTVLAGEPPVPVIVLERTVRDAGAAAVRDARRAATDGARPADADIAWLALLLQRTDVRDEAIRGCDGSPAELRLWTDVTRRAEPSLAPAPACLLALNAYLAGDDMLAIVGIERALRSNPEHRLARLIAAAQATGLDRDTLRRLVTTR